MKQPTRLPWWNSLATVLTIEWCGAELNTARRWVGQLVKPITYLALLGVGMSTALGGTDYLDFIFPGIIVMQAANGLNRMVIRAVTERRWGLAAFKLQSGVPESAYFAGMLIPDVVIYLVQTVALGVVAVMLGCHLGAMQIVLAVLVGIPAAWFWSCFGYTLTGFVTNYQTRDFVLSTILLPLTFSAPVFYSLDRAPLFLRAIGMINPLTYQVEFARGIIHGHPTVPAATVTAICLAAITVLGLASTKQMRRLSFEG